MSLFANGTNYRLFKMGRIDARDELSLFGVWDELSLVTNCCLGRIVAWDELSLGTNCRLGRIVAWDELSPNQYWEKLLDRCTKYSIVSERCRLCLVLLSYSVVKSCKVHLKQYKVELKLSRQETFFLKKNIRFPAKNSPSLASMQKWFLTLLNVPTYTLGS